MSPAAPSVVVTIDGPAGSGKSSAAEALAGRLGWQVLDTGAMYRAAGVLALERGVDPSNGPAVAAVPRQSVIDFDWSSSPPEIRLDGRPIGEAIRSPAATAAASAVAPHPEVRACLVESQRRIAAEHPRLVVPVRQLLGAGRIEQVEAAQHAQPVGIFRGGGAGL